MKSFSPRNIFLKLFKANSTFGFALPATTFFVLAFLTIPVIFWSLYKYSEGAAVNGAQTISPKDGKGFTIQVNAAPSTWDLNIYVCQSKEECLKSLTSGKKFTTVNGGELVSKVFAFDYNEKWEEGSLVKVFMRLGWGTSKTPFKLLNPTETPYIDVQTIKDDSKEYQVILMNVADLKKMVVGPIIYSNR